MEDKNQKERLEQELRFLKESFDAEVISKEEYEKGKERIEKKLKGADEKSANGKTEEKKEEAQGYGIEAGELPEEGIASNEGEKIKLKLVDQDSQEKPEEQPETKPGEGIKEEPKESKFWKFLLVIIIIGLIGAGAYYYMKGTIQKNEPNPEPACLSDENCKKEGMAGKCMNAGKKEAECQFTEIPKTKITVLTSKGDCINCDISRVVGILESWFGPSEATEVDYSSDEGKKTAGKYDAKVLPMFILDGSIEQKESFQQFKRSFTKRNDSYVLSDNVAASSVYIRRENIPMKLDLLAIKDDPASLKAEANLKEFLVAFKDADYEKHLAAGELSKELNIRVFPTFLVNNMVKFSGVHSAENIKDNFCKLNEADECGQELSESLVS